jgi:hypothetical protein
MVSWKARALLDKVLREFDRMLGETDEQENIAFEKTTPQQLTKFGLTVEEARIWLNQEPDYVPAPEKKQFQKHPKKEQDLQVLAHQFSGPYLEERIP